jgi:hypothetical protein
MSASAGTFIASSLQTAGQYYQSYVLDLITYSLGGLVVLCFIVGVMASMVGIVFQGGMRSSLLLLLGPALYFAAVFQRSEVPPVEWTQAQTPEAQASVGESVDTIDAATKYTPRPSSLFSGFDSLVSGFVKQTSSALRTTGEKMDLSLVVKSQLLGFLMTPEITDPGLKELLHLSLLGECRAMVQAGQEMSDPRNRPAERCEWAKSYGEIATKNLFKLTPNASKYVASLAVDVPMLLETPVVDDLGAELTKLEKQLQTPIPYYGFQPFTCDTNSGAGIPATGDAAELAQSALQQNAYVRNQIVATLGGVSGLPRSSDSVEALQAYYDERDAKVEARVGELSAKSFTCHEIWNVVYVALHYEAAMSLEATKAEGAKDGFDPDKLVADLAAMSGVDDMNELVRAISRKLFRLENARGSAAAIVQEYANRGPDVRNIEVNDSEDINARIRQDTLEAEWTGQASLIQTAMMIPYYQGLILFFLSIAFPFFALLLAIPGRALGFCMWFGLWFWVKSWDIGYALVSMLDRVMYSIFVAKMDSGYVSAKTMLDLDFSSAIAALRDSDPTFNVGTYYSIMGVCVLAVPVISAQLVVQVAGGIASIVRGQLLNAQQSAAQTAANLQRMPYKDKDGAWHAGSRQLGSGGAGDVTAQVLNDAARLIPLDRSPRGVTVIDDATPKILPERTPNLISTSGRRNPSIMPPTTAKTTNNLTARRDQSRWEMIDYTQDLNDPEVVEGPTSSDGQKNLETPLTNLPRLPDTK